MTSRWELRVLVFIALVTGLIFAQPVLFPLFLVFFLYLLFSPLHELLIKIKIPSVVGSALIVGLLLALIATGIIFLVDPATEWIKKAPDFFHNIEGRILKKPLEKFNETSTIAVKLSDVTGKDSMKISILSLANALFSLTSSAIIFLTTILVLLFFTLSYFRLFMHKLDRFIYKKQDRDKEARLFIHLRNELSAYLFIFMFICAGLGLFMALIFWLLDVPNPVLWGVMVMFLTFIPYVGHFIGILIILLVSFMTFNSWISIILPPLFYLIVSAIEGQIITPMIMGNRLNLNPLLIILSMFFWGCIWGISGIIISIPLLIIVKISIEHIPELMRYSTLFEK